MSITLEHVNVVSPTLARSLFEAEASSRAEGVDTTHDVAYQAVKARLLVGEITSDEAVAIYASTIESSTKTK